MIPANECISRLCDIANRKAKIRRTTTTWFFTLYAPVAWDSGFRSPYVSECRQNGNITIYLHVQDHETAETVMQTLLVDFPGCQHSSLVKEIRWSKNLGYSYHTVDFTADKPLRHYQQFLI